MDSVVVVTPEERSPLLNPRNSPTPEQSEIYLSPPVERQPPSPPPSKPSSDDPKQRLVSLDVFRGLTVALMILVDDAGGAFPSINHSPWMGVTIADFVMPFFLFSVGVSVALVFKNCLNKVEATKKVAERTIKLFLLGVLLQGGYFHGRNRLTYGVDIEHIRWMGVLQRIALGYFLAAMSEIWLGSNVVVDSLATVAKKHCIKWTVAILLSATYVCLLYGLYVPDWKFEVSSGSALSASNNGEIFRTVHCGLRGSMSPPCNAVGLIDRYLLGESHLYQRPVYRRTKECSINSPDYGPLPLNAPEWCLAPFDPEGILSSVMATVTCFVGLYFGHLIVHFKGHKERVTLWILSSLILLLVGCIIKVLGVPFSKPLYTVSYMLITSGFSGALLTAIYILIDVKHFRRPSALLQWMGMNAFIVYALAACEVFPAAIQGFYWRNPSNNLVNGTETVLQTVLHSKRWGTMAFVLVEIIFWCLFAGFLHMRGIYIKL